MIKTDYRAEDDLQLNMTPMIDMIFLLIIFFLTATTFTQKEREQEVLLPSARGTGSLSKALETSMIINVKKDGEIFVEGRKCEAKDLEPVVRDRNARAKNALKVKIRGDQRAMWGSVASVFGAVARAGVSRPYVDYKEVLLEP